MQDKGFGKNLKGHLPSTENDRKRASPFKMTTVGGRSGDASRKMTRITPFQHTIQADPEFAEKTWNVLENAIREVFERNTGNLSYEQLYRLAYTMVLAKFGDFLYNNVNNTISDHLKTLANSLSSRSELSDYNLLKELRTEWDWYKLSISHLRDILMYMDRTFVANRKKKSVYDLGVGLFRDIVVRDARLQPMILKAFLDCVDRDRNEEPIDWQLLGAITKLLSDMRTDARGLNVYQVELEKPFLEHSARYYRGYSQTCLATMTCAGYLSNAETKLAEENRRVEQYLESRTRGKLESVLLEELIEKNLPTLIDMPSGLVYMLQNDRIADLKLLRSIFRRVPAGENVICQGLKKEVVYQGMKIVGDGDDAREPVEMVRSLLDLKAKYDKILASVFSVSSGSKETEDGPDVQMLPADSGPETLVVGAPSLRAISTANVMIDKRYLNVVHEGFEECMNSYNRSAEYLSLYVDLQLRQEFKDMNEDDIDTRLNADVTLFRFLQDKDVFARYYTQHLSKRLLQARVTSDDAERSFLVKLKNECGFLYTSKMESMFNDIKTSEDIQASYRAWRSSNMEIETDEGAGDSSTELRVTVLTTGAWPIQPTPLCTLPKNLLSSLASFETFYYSKHEGRKLAWQTSHGTAEIRGYFQRSARPYEMSVSVHSMVVLMLFNAKNSLLYEEIAAESKIPETDLQRTLQTLSLAKYRVLSKEPATKTVSNGDRFMVNDSFTSKLYRFRIQTISSSKETDDQRAATQSKIEGDRKPQIEAAIVRVMKSRRILEHNNLVIEVMEQLAHRFSPAPADIKSRIESLIEREFLHRDETNQKLYRYVA